jgi:hypothetical protein
MTINKLLSILTTTASASLGTIVKINVGRCIIASLRSARRRRHYSSHSIILYNLGKASTILRQSKRPSDRKYYTSSLTTFDSLTEVASLHSYPLPPCLVLFFYFYSLLLVATRGGRGVEELATRERWCCVLCVVLSVNKRPAGPEKDGMMVVVERSVSGGVRQ